MNRRTTNRIVRPRWFLAVALWPAFAWADETLQNEERRAAPLPAAVLPSNSAVDQEAGTLADELSVAVTPEEIAAWIADLDDNRYLVRELASQRLLEAGTPALDPLLAVANADRPEPADRAVWILRRISNTKELAVRRLALERLVLLEKRPQVAAAARDALAHIHHDEAVQAIQQLGGKFISPYVDAFGPYMAGRVILDHGWRGGDAGLAHLRHLIGLRQVIIIGTDVSLKGLHELRNVARLDELWLYGTKVDGARLPEIQKSLPQVAIDYRRGALLGVGSNTPDGMGPAVVGTVQPGSVAAAAGIQVGDIIQKFESQPVPNFKSLTGMIGKHGAGDEVTLEVLRGGQPIEFKVKLGQWQTINF